MTDEDWAKQFPGLGGMALQAQIDNAKARANYEADPANKAAVQRQSDEANALRVAQTASMGALTGTPYFSSGVSDPSTAFQKFVQSGYTGAQAMNDGWLTGVGNPGWQNTAGYQAPLNPQGMIGAPYAQQQIQQYQQAQQQTPTGGGANPYGSQSRNSPAATAYGQAPQRGGIYQQLNSMLGSGGGGQNPFGQGGGFSQAPPRMQGSSGMPAGGYGQRQNMLGQSPGWQSFLSNLKPAAGF